MANPALVSVLATSFLAGEHRVEQVVERAVRTLGRNWRWLRPVAERYVAWVGDSERPRHREVVDFLSNDQGFDRACAVHYNQLEIAQWLAEPQRMQPVAPAAAWDIPPIESAGALAEWFEIAPNELEWFADLKGLVPKSGRPRLDHYHYRLLTKRYGNIRLIEAPKPRLKQLQRQILARILEKIPPHPAVHGFVKKRSVRTFAAPHAGQRVVLRMDLRDFFPSFAAARIQTLFRTLGYPESVADRLGGISTNVAPPSVWRHPGLDVNAGRLREARALYSRPHLPQGAPTSPALANICTYRVDCRLAGLAKSAGARYTRYADDLAFSGGREFERRVERFSRHVAAVLMEEGFSVNHRKTRIMRQGVRQHLAGLVTNRGINLIRADFDRLKAILTNCVRLGPESQNREGHPNFRLHLEGRVVFVESINPDRGKRLREIFDEIRWP